MLKTIVFVVKFGILGVWSAGCVYAGFQIRPIYDQGLEMVESVQRVQVLRNWISEE